LGDELGGHDRSRLEKYMEENDLEEVNVEAEDREGGAMVAETLFIG
jgi:nitrogen fixation protein